MQQDPVKPRKVHIDLPADIHVRLLRRQLEFEPIYNIIKRLLDRADAEDFPGARSKEKP